MRFLLLAGKRSLEVIRSLGFLFVVMAAPAIAQVAPNGTISGAVKDPGGLVVANARVTVVNTEENIPRTTLTDTHGTYSIPALPIGHYNVKVETTGFKASTKTNLTLDIGQEAVVDFTLQVGDTQDQVVVQADEARVDTTSSSIGHLVDNQQIVELPLNGRNFVDLTLLQTGVTQYQNNQFGTSALYGEFFSSNGAPLRSNMYSLDGAIMGNIQGASASSITGESLGLDGIAEYKVMTNSFGAEYGLAMGSQTAIVTKSGTNQFHGDVFEYLRNSVLNASQLLRPALLFADHRAWRRTAYRTIRKKSVRRVSGWPHQEEQNLLLWHLRRVPRGRRRSAKRWPNPDYSGGVPHAHRRRSGNGHKRVRLGAHRDGDGECQPGDPADSGSVSASECAARKSVYLSER